VFRKKILSRGAKGIIGLQRIFKIMDDDNSKSLNRYEFEKACRDFKIDISSEDIGTLYNAFDMNRDGTVQYDEFLRIIRGDMSQFRRNLVEQAFKKLDRDGSGVVDENDIKDVYNASRHPAVLEGRKTESQVLGEFLETFETHHAIQKGGARDHSVTLEEFIEYYTNVGASIDDDQYFAQMINSSWNIQGNAAQYKQYDKGWSNEAEGPKTSFGKRP